MSGVFISYQRGDEALARRITLALRALGVDVWWDQDMLSVDWQAELERRGNELAAVAVVWSPNAAVSDSVRDEARLGLKSKKLVNLLNGLAEPPYPFDRVNGIPLDSWEGVAPHSNWRRFVASIDEKLAAHGSIENGALIARATAQEDEFRKREREIAAAESAVASARRKLVRESAAVADLRDKLGDAEAQLDGLRKMKVSPAVLATARSEHEAASARLCTAEADIARAEADIEEADCKLETAKRAMTQWIAEQGGAGSESVATLAAPDLSPETPPLPDPPRSPPAPPASPPPSPPKPSTRADAGTGGETGWRLPANGVMAGLMALVVFAGLVFSIWVWRTGSATSQKGEVANATAAADNITAAAPSAAPGTLLDAMIERTWALNLDCSTQVRFARVDGGVRVTVRVPDIDESSSVDRIVEDGIAAFRSSTADYRTAPGAAGRTEVLRVTPADGSKPYEISPCLTSK